MKPKTTDEDQVFIRRIAQIGIWRIAREYQQCLREIEYYAKSYVREYLSKECRFCSWYYEDDTEIVIVYKSDNEEHCVNVELQELVEEGLKNTYLC